MEQVGYDMYCKLLDEVMKEMKGEKYIEPAPDIQIDIDVSSYIPDEYIENSELKISIYQDIALCKNEEEILDITDEIIDRFGTMPKEVENLTEIARIKNLCREKYINKVVQRNENIIFYFEMSKFDISSVDNIIKKFGNKVKFSKAIPPYITYKINRRKANNKTDKGIFTKYVGNKLCIKEKEYKVWEVKNAGNN